ncbi:MAG: hypothetical protein ACOC8E_02030 [Planctomycetota bacterium]
MIDASKIALKGIKVALILIVPFLVAVYAFGRPKAAGHYYTLAFERRPTPAERERTVELLRGRLADLAEPDWQAWVRPNRDGTLALGYRKPDDPGDLAALIIPQGRCEFRFMHPDQRRAPEAQKNGPPDGYEVVEYMETCFRYDEETGTPVAKLVPCLVEAEPLLRPTGFRKVSFWTEGFIRESHLRIEFLPEDARRLAEAKERQPDASVALIVDGHVRVGYRSLGPIEKGALETQGLLDNEPIEKLAVVLDHGPLPVPLRLADYTRIGAE